MSGRPRVFAHKASRDAVGSVPHPEKAFSGRLSGRPERGAGPFPRGGFGSGKFAGNAAFVENVDAVAHAERFGQFAGNHHDARAALREAFISS
jgi:hypothetical protein